MRRQTGRSSWLRLTLGLALAFVLFQWIAGNRIWAPALVHSIVEGAVKLAVPMEADSPYAGVR